MLEWRGAKIVKTSVLYRSTDCVFSCKCEMCWTTISLAMCRQTHTLYSLCVCVTPSITAPVQETGVWALVSPHHCQRAVNEVRVYCYIREMSLRSHLQGVRMCVSALALTHSSSASQPAALSIFPFLTPAVGKLLYCKLGFKEQESYLIFCHCASCWLINPTSLCTMVPLPPIHTKSICGTFVVP